jgi:hypothetical protein
MSFTMADAYAFGGYTDLEAGVMKKLDEINPIVKEAIWTPVDGAAYKYRNRLSLPTTGFRHVNGTVTPSNGTINEEIEKLLILTGEVRLDRAEVKLQGRGDKAISLKADQYDMLVQSASNTLSQSFFEGDDIADTASLVGLRQRLTGSQVIAVGSNGGALTLALLDQLIGLVPFPANGKKILYMNRTDAQTVTTLLRASGVSVIYNVSKPGDTGVQADSYGGCPIRIIENNDDATSILGKDEQCGSSAVTSSIYCVAWGTRLVKMLYGGGDKILSVEDMGEMQERRSIMGFLEFYPGLAMLHNRAAARLRGVI